MAQAAHENRVANDTNSQELPTQFTFPAPVGKSPIMQQRPTESMLQSRTEPNYQPMPTPESVSVITGLPRLRGRFERVQLFAEQMNAKYPTTHSPIVVAAAAAKPSLVRATSNPLSALHDTNEDENVISNANSNGNVEEHEHDAPHVTTIATDAALAHTGGRGQEVARRRPKRHDIITRHSRGGQQHMRKRSRTAFPAS